MSFLVGSKILRLFVNILSAEYQYSRRNMQNFWQQIETQLPQKRNAFSAYFITFLKCTSILENFEEKDESSSLNIPDIIDS